MTAVFWHDTVVVHLMILRCLSGIYRIIYVYVYMYMSKCFIQAFPTLYFRGIKMLFNMFDAFFQYWKTRA